MRIGKRLRGDCARATALHVLGLFGVEPDECPEAFARVAALIDQGMEALEEFARREWQRLHPLQGVEDETPQDPTHN